ncbi:MAG: Hsp20/alpha crystallin family protein [Anaerolineales bacterium]
MLTYYVSPRRHLAQRLARLNDSRYPDVHIPMDVIEEGDDYIITALLPGISAEDLNIEVLENTVSISGEFSVDGDEETRYLLQERPSGKFSRTLRLPVLLDDKGAEAEVKDGILRLRIPQAEEAKAKLIKVKAN